MYHNQMEMIFLLIGTQYTTEFVFTVKNVIKL